ncbi:MAG: carbohydrate-binding family 9-like protein [Kiritimatiellae bacterium]|nr:carbohydrate-binding family 9-like protein [Kiritimatiellia bacterium]
MNKHMNRHLVCACTVGALMILGSGCAMLRPCRPEAAPEARAAMTSEAIRIDGVLDESAWQQASVITNFTVPESFTAPVSFTEARILWDQEYLYVAFKAMDKDVWGYFEKHDDSTCQEDVLEVFIQPDAEEGSYYNFEVNALGACLDGWIPKGKRGHIRRGVLWNCPGVKTAAKVQGTLNDWRDEDTGWQLEIAIPFASLPTLARRVPQAGETWKFHLARYDYSVYLPKDGVELTSCARLSKVNFHLHEDWMPLRFER